jgi:hypothetical protein
MMGDMADMLIGEIEDAMYGKYREDLESIQASGPVEPTTEERCMMGIGSDIIDDGMVMYGNNIQTYEEEARANQEKEAMTKEVDNSHLQGNQWHKLPRLSEEKRRELHEILDTACKLMKLVDEELKGTIDGAMTIGLETTAGDFLWRSIALYDARDALVSERPLSGRERRKRGKIEYKRKKREKAEVTRKWLNEGGE